MVPLCIRPVDERSRNETLPSTRGPGFVDLLGGRDMGLLRVPVPPSAPYQSHHHGFLPYGVGCTFSGTHCARCVVREGKKHAHKRSRTTRSRKGTALLRKGYTRTSSSYCNRQHDRNVLLEQTRRDAFGGPPISITTNLGLVHSEGCTPVSESPPRRTEHTRRHTKQKPTSTPRVVATLTRGTQTIPSMGFPGSGFICDKGQFQVLSVLCSTTGTSGEWVFGRCISDEVVRQTVVRLPASAPPDEGRSEDSGGQCQVHSDNTMVAEAAMVFASPPDGQGKICPPAVQDRSSIHSGGSSLAPGGRQTEVNRMAGPPESIATFSKLPQSVLKFIEAAHRSSTRRSYLYKWTRYTKYCTGRQLEPTEAPVSVILEFLVSLLEAGLSHSSLKCYLAAISWFRRKKGYPSCFSDPMVKTFMRGVANVRPSVAPVTPGWSLDIVLSRLVRPPFEPMATIDLSYLSWKTAFLVAITTARRASELNALRVDPPYMRFHREKAVLRTDVAFLPKVSSRFHMSQDIVLPAFYQNPTSPIEKNLHSLDVRRALAFYVDRTSSFRKTPRLFVQYRTDTQGMQLSSQRLSGWIVSLIKLCYRLAGKELPQQVKGHSTRSMSTSAAFLKGVSLDAICRAAIWSSPLSFVTHYKLDVVSRKDTEFGRAVLFSAVA
ncbi:uncharacterized protein [Anolis sagrei]|uniref:uncharacterized protein n=1 Tax=Anolis sagrei TaxID=38937 RepID=UPI0035210AA0